MSVSRRQRLSTTAPFVIHRLLGRWPHPYFFVRQRLTDKPELAADERTELVIEGYPRSANSFAVVAFEQAQERAVRIAHHLHVPAQIIYGVRHGLPTIVLLREPVAAVSSLVVREPALALGVALWDYIGFHRAIQRYQSGFLVARFEEVTSDYGAVIRRVNEKWGTEFEPFRHDKDNVAQAFQRLDRLENRVRTGEVNEDRVARPSQARQEKAEAVRERLLSPAYAGSLRRARGLYESFHALGA